MGSLVKIARLIDPLQISCRSHLCNILLFFKRYSR
jgi:hypothetical protein